MRWIPEGSFYDSFIDEELTLAIDALPVPYRVALVLSDVQGLRYAEIAQVLEVPEGTVKSRLFRGLRQVLQKKLFRYAVEEWGTSDRGSRGPGRRRNTAGPRAGTWPILGCVMRTRGKRYASPRRWPARRSHPVSSHPGISDFDRLPPVARATTRAEWAALIGIWAFFDIRSISSR